MRFGASLTFAVLLFSPLESALAQTGPANVWTPIGPFAATIQALAIDPANSNHLLAGTYFGGIYQSADAGTTWSHVDWPFLSYPVFAIAFNRQKAGTVYAGTFQGGVLKSTDSGLTWKPADDGLTDINVLNLAIDPFNPSVVLAVTSTRIFRSDNSAASWVDITERIGSITGRVIVFDPANEGTIYLGTVGSGVYRSKDGGVTWNSLAEGMGNRVITGLSLSDGSFPRLYAATSDGIGFELKFGAESWTTLTIWPAGPKGPVYQVFPRPQTFGILLASTGDGIYVSRDDGITWFQSTRNQASFIVSDVFGSILYAAGVDGGLTSTVDLGKTWTSRLRGFQNLFIGGLYSAGSASGSRLYAASEYGVLSADSNQLEWSTAGIGKHVFTVQGLPHDESTVLAGTENNGVWSSADKGVSWNPTYSGIVPETVYSIAASPSQPTVVYAGTSGGVYVSPNGGKTWNPPTSVNIPTVLSIGIDPQSSLTAYFGSLGGQIYKTTTGGVNVLLVFKTDDPKDNITHLLVSPNANNRVYAITASGILYLSDDFGLKWFPSGPAGVATTCIDVDPIAPWKLYAGTPGFGVYRSEDAGFSWAPIPGGPEGTVFSIVVDPLNSNIVYAASDKKISRWDSETGLWTGAGNGLPSGSITALLIDPFTEGTLYASVQNQGVYVTRDQGGSWEAKNQGLSADVSTALAVDPNAKDRLYAGAKSKGIYVSTESAGGWSESSVGMTLFVRGLAVDAQSRDTIYAGSLLGGMFKSADRGQSWNPAGLLGKIILQVKADPQQGGKVFAATSDGVTRTTDGGLTWLDVGQKVGYIFSVAVSPENRDVVFVGGSGGQIFRSSDHGASWQERGAGIPQGSVLSIAMSSDLKLCAVVQVPTEEQSIYRSNDGGQSWSPAQIAGSVISNAVRVTVDLKTNVFYAATNGSGVLVSFDGQAWAPYNAGLLSTIVSSVVGNPTRPGTIYAATLDEGVFVSTRGSAWTAANKGLQSKAILDIAADYFVDGLLYVGCTDGLYKSTNGGTSWARVQSGLPNSAVLKITVDPFQAGALYVTTDANLWKSLDRGISWKAADANLPTSGIQTVQFGSDSRFLYGGLLGGGFVISTDGGASWSSAATPSTIDPFVLCLAFHPHNSSTLYAGTSAGLIQSKDGGDSWIALPSSPTGGAVLALAIDPDEPRVIYAGTSAGVFLSTNAGESWSPILAGMFNTNVTALAIDAANSRVVYAGTEGGGVFRYVRGT